jgi:hypothetical protein
MSALVDINRLFLAPLFAACCVAIVFSALIHVHYYRWLLRRRDPAEYDRTRGWYYFPPFFKVLNVCDYFLRREYLVSDDPGIRRHGGILRWTYSIALLGGAIVLVLAMLTELSQKAR